MPTYRTGNMWDAFGETDWFLFTSNPIVNKKGQAVMGRGMALELAKAFPKIREDFALKLPPIKQFPSNVCTVGRYGPKQQRVGCFKVKDHWANFADLDLIMQSSVRLVEIINSVEESLGKTLKVDLNFPGIGNGGLPRDVVKPILDEYLPTNVNVWEYGKV